MNAGSPRVRLLPATTLNVPNTLTFLRVLAIPAFLVCLTDRRFGAALCIFVFAGITDAVDGAVARLTNTHTSVGAALDPLADKLLMVSAFSVLGWYGAVWPWLAVLVLSREALLLLGYLVLALRGQAMEIRPSALGKVNTFCQLFTVGFALLALARPDLPLGPARTVAQSVTAATTASSGAQYLYRGLLWAQNAGKESPGKAARS
ncbi:MAG: CDP-alcohol phosphatidyltransferase [Candidatus Binatia bacterium]|nr:MAG: CDP-alcohol phosphatidyltransferase [Candidatus Binatia bacterium]